MTLFRLVSPDAMVMEERGTSKRFAKNSIQASFARPSTGGAVKANFIASPTSPIMAFLLARGWTLTAKLTPAAVSRIGIMNSDFTTESQKHRELQPSDPADNVEAGESILPKIISTDLSVTLCLCGDLSARPHPKNCRSHAHAGRALLNGNFKIVRHPHRKRVHINGGQ